MNHIIANDRNLATKSAAHSIYLYMYVCVCIYYIILFREIFTYITFDSCYFFVHLDSLVNLFFFFVLFSSSIRFAHSRNYGRWLMVYRIYIYGVYMYVYIICIFLFMHVYCVDSASIVRSLAAFIYFIL